MSHGEVVADVADLRTTGDDVDYPFWSGLSGFVRLVITVRDGVLPFICKEVSEMASFEELSYLQPEHYAIGGGVSMVCMVLAPLGDILVGVWVG